MLREIALHEEVGCYANVRSGEDRSESGLTRIDGRDRAHSRFLHESYGLDYTPESGGYPSLCFGPLANMARRWAGGSAESLGSVFTPGSVSGTLAR